MEKLTFEVVCLNGYRNFKGQNAYLKIKVWSILKHNGTQYQYQYILAVQFDKDLYKPKGLEGSLSQEVKKRSKNHLHLWRLEMSTSHQHPK